MTGSSFGIGVPGGPGTDTKRALYRAVPRTHHYYTRVGMHFSEPLRAGWAVAYVQYSANYVSAEQRAQDAKIGIWQGAFMLPSQWRARAANR